MIRLLWSIPALILATPALAEVCDKERPGWDGTPISVVEEVINQLTNPLTALVILVAIVLMWVGRLWSGILALLLTTIYLVLFIEPNPMDDVQWAARREGCIGDASLWYVFCFALAAMAWLRFGHLLYRRFS